MKQYTFHIDTGSGYVQFYPLFENINWINNKEDMRIFPLESLDGNIKFSGDEYTILYNLVSTNNTLPIKMYFNGVLKFSGLLDLIGSYDIIKKQAVLKIKNYSAYDKIIERESEDINIFGVVVSNSMAITGHLPLPYCYNINAVIEYLIEKFTDDVYFDSSSFLALPDLDVNWENIFLVTAYSIHYGYTGFPASEAKINFKSIQDILADLFHVYWYLESISGVLYFRLIHIKDVNIIAESIDLTSYKGRSWYNKDDMLNYKSDKRYNLIKRNFTAGQLDFKGKDIEIHAFDKVPLTKEISTNNFLTDIKYAYDGAENINYSTDMWFLLCASINEDEDPLIIGQDETVLEIKPSFSYSFSFARMWPNRSSAEIERVLTSGNADILFYVKFGAQLQNTRYRLELSVRFLNPVTTEKIFVRNKDVVEPWGVVEYRDIWKEEFGGDGIIGMQSVSLATMAVQKFDMGVVGNENNGVGMTMYFICEDVPLGQKIWIENIWVTQFTEYDIISDYGILEPTVSRLNMPLSLSNIDDKAGKYEMPATPVVMNGVSTAVNVKQDIYINDIVFPLNDLSLVDFTKYIKTIYGNIEPTNISISLKQDFAKLTGRVL